ncbi:MAG: hypothetical protein WKF91_13620 [Segetibacter sp.]
MKNFLFPALSVFMLISCTKDAIDLSITSVNNPDNKVETTSSQNNTAVVQAVSVTIKYTIRAGQHYCDQNTLKSIRVSQMNFTAKFDNSAIYTTIDPVNQYDINKLYGFSEGFNHQYNSARIGWAYNNGALRLYAYAYNKGVRLSTEITTVNIGDENNCSIKLSGYNYIFTVNGVSKTLSRANSTSTASGYQLYPYFGGDEVAPQNINLYITNL